MMRPPSQELADLALAVQGEPYDEAMIGVVISSSGGTITVQPNSGEAVPITMRCVGVTSVPANTKRVLFIRTRDGAYVCLGTIIDP